MKFSKQFFLVLFFLLSEILSAKESAAVGDSVVKHNFIEAGYGTGMVNSRFTMAAGFILLLVKY
jgi:hypothetical protein